MKKVLEPFQDVGARFLASNFHAALGDQRGLGKTPQAIWAADYVAAKTVLVICPASVRTSWHDHVVEHFGSARGWDIISFERALNEIDADLFLRSKYDVCIVDESHFCKTLDSQRTQAVFGPNGLIRRANYKWCLSGTMAPNGRPVELYPMLKALNPRFRGMSFTAYTQKFCGAYFDGRGTNVKGASHLDELRAMLDGFLLRRTAREVYPDRKAPLVTPTPVELSPRDLAAVIEEEDAIGGRVARLSSSYEHFSQMGDTAKLLRLLGQAMVPRVAQFCEDLLVSENKIVVFFHHSDVGAQLQAHFAAKRLRPVIYQGGMSDASKDDVVKMFAQAPEVRVFLGQRQASGTGINGLQRVCSTAVVAEPSWTPGETDQLVGRLDRIGQADDLVTAYIMYAKGTLSAVVHGVHERKASTGARLGV